MRILKQMLKKGVDVNRCNSDDKTPLILALENGHDEAVRTSKPDDLTRKAETCKPDAVNLLIQAGADVNKDRYDRFRYRRITPLWYAVEYNCVQCVTLLLEAGADVNKYCCNWDTPLWLAVENNYVQCVSL